MEDWYVEKVHLESIYVEYKDDFFIAYLDDELLGFIVAQKHTREFATISNFIIVKKFRSFGYGKELFSFALDYLDSYQISLECEKEKEFFYKKYGFKRYYDSVLYQYKVQKNHVSNCKNIKKQVDSELLSSYNKKHFDLKFSNHINTIVEHKDTKYRVIYLDSKVSSYGLRTNYEDGYKLLISASNYEEAKEIFIGFLESCELNSKIYLEASILEPILLKIVKEFNMKVFSKKSKMYNKILK